MQFAIDTTGKDRDKHIENLTANYKRASRASLNECLGINKNQLNRAKTQEDKYIARVHIEVIENLLAR